MHHDTQERSGEVVYSMGEGGGIEHLKTAEGDEGADLS